uniref:IS3 family transposase n=1 Tax=Enterocloster clostridioformis TaxID=1531 RepID=UPI003FA4938C
MPYLQTKPFALSSGLVTWWEYFGQFFLDCPKCFRHFYEYDQLCDAIASYIHFYNCERYQKRLGCMMPMEFLAVGGK